MHAAEKNEKLEEQKKECKDTAIVTYEKHIDELVLLRKESAAMQEKHAADVRQFRS